MDTPEKRDAILAELLLIRRTSLIDETHFRRCLRYVEKHPELAKLDPIGAADAVVKAA
jgi:hypothetical protein